ncbi:MAG TPA: aldo/keto reductase, partial [Nitrososphaerales archaeon]|nr:aldo/keto reductase [Nitrososphaerales archaeon]
YKRDAAQTSHRFRKDSLLRQRFFRPEDFDVLERLEEVSGEVGARPAQAALAWLFSKNDVRVPIVGPTTVSQLDELVESVDIRLTSDQVKRLEEPYRPHPVLEHN